MKSPILDTELIELLRTAIQPGVRAVVAEALIAGKARWANGRKKVWIDKRYGFYRFEPVYEERQLTTSTDPVSIVAEALEDPSPIVRRAAFSSAMNGAIVGDQLKGFAEMLSNDPSPSVRERALWVLRNTQK